MMKNTGRIVVLTMAFYTGIQALIEPNLKEKADAPLIYY
jgi:hypothetical protein